MTANPNHPQTLLVVDDSLSVQKAACQAFADTPTMRVATCGDAESAEKFLSARVPDLILCDVILPGRSGYDLCQTIQERFGASCPPILLLRSAFEPFDEVRAQQLDAAAILNKPFTSDQLKDLTRLALEHAEEESPGAGPQAQVPTRYPELTPDEVAELTAADVLASQPPGAVDPQRSTVDYLADCLVEPVSARILEPLSRRLASDLERTSLPRLVRQAVADTAERLIRRRLWELEADAIGEKIPDSADTDRES
ncbi:MAG: response regulator [Acidobacteriota bacterium]